MTSAKEVGATGWYSLSKNLVDPLMVNRAKILDLVRKGKFSSIQAKNMCKYARKKLKDGISLAKVNWTSHLTK